MAGFPWLKVASDLREHEKSIRLAALLRDKRAWSWVVGLWMWCADQEGSGHIEGDEARGMVEFGAGWDGKPGVLVAALLKVGFVEDDGHGGIIVHDWVEWQEKHVEKRAKDRARQQRHRAKSRPTSRVTPTDTDPPVTRDVTPKTAPVTRIPSKDSRDQRSESRSEEEDGAAAPASSAAEGEGSATPRSEPPPSAPECEAPPSVAAPAVTRADSDAPASRLATGTGATSGGAPGGEVSDDELVRLSRPQPVVFDVDGQQVTTPPKLHELCSELRRRIVARTRRAAVLEKVHDEAWLDQVETAIEAVGFQRAFDAALAAGAAWPGGHAAIQSFRFYGNAVLKLAKELEAEPQPAEDDLAGSDTAVLQLRDVLRSRLRPDLYARWFGRMRGRRAGAAVELVAPDKFHLDFVTDNYLGLLRQYAAELGISKLGVVLDEPRAAAGGATC